MPPPFFKLLSLLSESSADSACAADRAGGVGVAVKGTSTAKNSSDDIAVVRRDRETDDSSFQHLLPLGRLNRAVAARP